MNWKRGVVILAVLLVIAVISTGIVLYKSSKEEPVEVVEIPAAEESVKEPVQEVKESVKEAPKEVTIHISRYDFDNANITIATGTKVIWVNDDSRKHMITNPRLGLFREMRKSLEEGDTFEYTFDKAGTYEILEANFGIRGIIIVKDNNYDPITGYVVYNLNTEGTKLLKSSVNLLTIVLGILILGFYFNNIKRK